MAAENSLSEERYLNMLDYTRLLCLFLSQEETLHIFLI